MAEKLPGKAGELASKPFESSRKAVRKSGAKGREGRQGPLLARVTPVACRTHKKDPSTRELKKSPSQRA